MSNSNEPAFPMGHLTNANGEVQWSNGGITKREYFAAMAMQGMLADTNRHPERQTLGAIADDALAMANVILAALEKS